MLYRPDGPKPRRERLKNLEAGVRVELTAQEMQAPVPDPLGISSPAFSRAGVGREKPTPCLLQKSC